MERLIESCMVNIVREQNGRKCADRSLREGVGKMRKELSKYTALEKAPFQTYQEINGIFRSVFTAFDQASCESGHDVFHQIIPQRD